MEASLPCKAASAEPLTMGMSSPANLQMQGAAQAGQERAILIMGFNAPEVSLSMIAIKFKDKVFSNAALFPAKKLSDGMPAGARCDLKDLCRYFRFTQGTVERSSSSKR